MILLEFIGKVKRKGTKWLLFTFFAELLRLDQWKIIWILRVAIDTVFRSRCSVFWVYSLLIAVTWGWFTLDVCNYLAEVWESSNCFGFFFACEEWRFLEVKINKIWISRELLFFTWFSFATYHNYLFALEVELRHWPPSLFCLQLSLTNSDFRFCI